MEDIINPQTKSIPNFGLSSLESVAYDTTSQAVITATQNKLEILDTASNTSTHFRIPNIQPLTSSQTTEEAKPEEKPTNNHFDRLRFLPKNAESKIAITHFGNILTNYSKNAQIAIANYGFSQGVHYWEIVCPNKCSGIEVGVAKGGWKLPPSEEVENEYVLFSFNTSTARTICIQLDLDNLEIHAWLQANEQNKKTEKLKTNAWYPCVRITEFGNVAILNTKNTPANIKKTSGLKQFSKNQLKKSLEFSLITVDQEAKGHQFNTKEELENFKKSSNNYQLIVESENIIKWGCQLARNQPLEETTDQLLKKAQEWLKDNLFKLVSSTKADAVDQQSLTAKIQEASTQIQKAGSQDSQQSLPENIQIKYIQANNSLLVQKGEYIKLVNRNNGTWNLSDIFAFNRPISPRDQVSLLLNLKDLQLLLQKLSTVQDFAKNLQNSAHLVGLRTLLEAIISAQTQNHIYSDHLLVNVAYKHAKRAIDTVLELLENSAQWIGSLLRGETQHKNCTVFRDLTEQELTTLLNFVSSIDEALYAMIHHEDAQDKLFAYWQGSSSRAFSSLDRIETLISLPESQFDIVKLSDLGLLSTDFLVSEFKHYDNSEILLDSEKLIHASTAEVESLVRNQLNQISKNIPLSVTLGNFPPQKQIEESQTLLTPENTPYAVNVSKKGEIKIWSTNKALVFLCKDDLTKPLLGRKPVLFQTSKDKSASTNPAQPPAFGFGGGGFGGGGFGFGAAPANQAANQNQEPEELEEDDGIQQTVAQPVAGTGFGAPVGGFGAPVGGFGATPGVFGGSSFGFGATPAGGLFGSPTITPATAALFASATTTPVTSGLFGSATATPAGGLFGSTFTVPADESKEIKVKIAKSEIIPEEKEKEEKSQEEEEPKKEEKVEEAVETKKET